MRRSQVAGSKYYSEPIHGHATVFAVTSNGVCPHCKAKVERLVGESSVREPGLSSTEIKERLVMYGLKPRAEMNQLIGGVNTPSEFCCNKCQHTVSGGFF